MTDRSRNCFKGNKGNDENVKSNLTNAFSHDFNEINQEANKGESGSVETNSRH